MSDDPTSRGERRMEEHPDAVDEQRRTRFYGAQPGTDDSVLVDHGGQAAEPAPPQGQRGEGGKPVETPGVERGWGQAAPDQGGGPETTGDPTRFTEPVETSEGGDQPVGGSMRPRPDLAGEQEERPAGGMGRPARTKDDGAS
jgi:hypothetical protein